MKKGDFVKVSYTGWCEGKLVETNDEAVAKKEKVYDSTRKYRPAIVIVGEGMVLPGIDKALEELGVGGSKKLNLEAKDAFGERRVELVQLVPMREFKKQNIAPMPGMVFEVSGRPARIQSVSSGRVRVDFNHPLAGKAVEYEIRIEEEAKTEEEKIKYLLGRSFRDEKLSYVTSGEGDKKRINITIPNAIKADRMYQIMKAILKVEAEKYLGIKEVEYDEGIKVAEKKAETIENRSELSEDKPELLEEKAKFSEENEN